MQENCCDGCKVDVAAREMTEEVFQKLIEPLSADLPAANRWYTFPPSLARQTGLFFLHGLLYRVLNRAFNASEDDAVGDQHDEDDYRAFCNKRKHQALSFLSSESAGLTLGAAFLATAPVNL